MRVWAQGIPGMWHGPACPGDHLVMRHGMECATGRSAAWSGAPETRLGMVARPEAQPAWYGVRGDVHRRACWHMLLYRSWPAWESYWRGRAFHLAQDIHALFFTLFMCSWRQKADLGFESVLGAPAVDSVGSSVTGCPLFHNGADSELYKTF